MIACSVAACHADRRVPGDEVTETAVAGDGDAT